MKEYIAYYPPENKGQIAISKFSSIFMISSGLW